MMWVETVTMRYRVLAVLLGLGIASAPAGAQTTGEVLFEDDFEGGLGQWYAPLGSGHRVVPAPGRAGSAMALAVVDQPVYVLAEGSHAWSGVRMEGEVLFPDDDHNYLGFIYGYRHDDDRIDFGSLYIKGNGSYVQGNTHRDTNVGRTYLPEARTNLEGPHGIVIGEWTRFALEVMDGQAHLYVGDLSTPVMTMDDAGSGGAIGLKPRNPGAPVLVDNISIRTLSELTHRGAPIPDPAYRRTRYLTEWEVLGPLEAHDDAVERGEGKEHPWRPAPADRRGAVRTADVVDFRGSRRVAYYRTTIESDSVEDAELRFSAVDDVAIWINGEFLGFAGREGYAWWDAAWNDERRSLGAPVRLRAGGNELIVRVVGGVYASGGFYAWLEGR